MNGCGQNKNIVTDPVNPGGGSGGSFFDGDPGSIRIDDETVFVETSRKDFQLWLSVAGVVLAFWALIRK